MKYKLVGMRGDIPFEMPFFENTLLEDFKMNQYVRDENEEICGVRCTADLGHGYGFDYGKKEFILHEGEEYSFSHSFTDITGPSDWAVDSCRITVRLVRDE